MQYQWTEWDEDVESTPDEEYQSLVRSLRRKMGFGLFFVRCSPVGGQELIGRVRADVPQKQAAVLELKEPIANLIDLVATFPNINNIKILFIVGLEKSLIEYIRTGYGGQGDYYNLDTVPPILSHLNWQRENFRDKFRHLCFVFLLPQFAIKYIIRRAPDFFDWGSGKVDFLTSKEFVEQESSHILWREYEEYLQLTQQQRKERIIEINELLVKPKQSQDRKAFLLFEQGNIFLANKQYEEAISSYDQALQIKSDKDAAWNNRGIALFKLGRYKEAIASYDQALQIKTDDHQAWYNRGIALSNLGINEEAINSYKKALKIQPDFQEASDNLFRVLWDTGRYCEATAISEKHPKRRFNVDNELFKAYSFINNGDYISALVPLYALVKNDLDNYKALNLLGAALAKIGRTEEAIKNLDQSLQIKPDFYDAWINKGCVLQDSLKYIQALESFDKAIETEPDLCEGWYLRGIALSQLNRWEEAITAFDKILQIQSNFSAAWKERGTALLSLQRYLEAINSFDKFLQFSPEDHEVWRNRGIGLMNLNRHEDAINSFDKALQFQPSFLEIWRLKGQALERLGRIKEANECYAKSGKYNPKSSQNQIANFVEESNTEKDISSHSNSSLDYPKGYIHPTVLKSKYDQLNNILKSPNQQSWLDWLRFIAF